MRSLSAGRYDAGMRSYILAASLVLCPALAQAAVAKNQGFRTVKDGSEVFVVLDRAPRDPAITETQDGVEVVLPHTRMARPFRMLEPRYFPTPVKTVTSFRRGKDLVVSIALKQKVQPKLDVSAKGGVVTVKLAFPPGEPDKDPPPQPKGKITKSEGASAERDRSRGDDSDGPTGKPPKGGWLNEVE